VRRHRDAPEVTLPLVRSLRQPHAALADLCDGFFNDVSFVMNCVRIEPDALPPVARQLLVHRDHMTVVLARKYGQPVRLRALQTDGDESHYARKIVLTLNGDGPIVEFGIVRLELQFVPPAVRDEIRAKAAPLGDILIRHNVLRRISPRWYFRFPPQTPIAHAFGRGGEAFGRVGTIYCNEEPAIDLLEVVCCDVNV